MKLPEIERHDFINGCYTDESRRIISVERERNALIRQRFEAIDIPILCTPELLEENIEKIKQWFESGGKINCYSDITPFSHGLSVVMLEDFTENFSHCSTFDKVGIIDEEGTEKIECSRLFKDIIILNKNLARVQYFNDTYSLISIENGKVLEPRNLYYIDSEFHDGLLVAVASSCAMQNGVPQTSKYVYFDESGKVVLTSDKYTSMGQFNNGLALVSEEKCNSRWLSFPAFRDQHWYDYYKYFIDKSGKVVINLGCMESARKTEYQLDSEPYNRIKGGKIFQADKYYELNGMLIGGLKFEEPHKEVKINQSFVSTQDMKNLILSKYYNPEHEMEKVIKRLKYYTDNWANIENIEYNSDGTIKETHSKKVPYIYYVNRDSVDKDIYYIPPKQKILK